MNNDPRNIPDNHWPDPGQPNPNGYNQPPQGYPNAYNQPPQGYPNAYGQPYYTTVIVPPAPIEPPIPYTPIEDIAPGDPDDEVEDYLLSLPDDPLAADEEGRALYTRNRAECRHTFTQIGISMVVFACALYFGPILINTILSAVAPAMTEAYWYNWFLSVVPLYGLALPLLLIPLLRVKPTRHNPYCHTKMLRAEKRPFTVATFLMLTAIALGCNQIGSTISTYIMSILSALTGYDYSSSLVSVTDASPLWLNFIVLCIVAPFGEEFIFRKLLVSRMRRYGDTVAILVSGLLFGLFHGNVYQLFYTALGGILLAYIYTRTGKYLLCVAMHSLLNLLGGILIPAVADYMLVEGAEVTLVSVAATLFVYVWIYSFMTAAVVLVATRWRKRQIARAPLTFNKRDVFRNPGMIAAFIVMGLVILETLIPRL